jgi:hypothetical protein
MNPPLNLSTGPSINQSINQGIAAAVPVVPASANGPSAVGSGAGAEIGIAIALESAARPARGISSPAGVSPSISAGNAAGSGDPAGRVESVPSAPASGGAAEAARFFVRLGALPDPAAAPESAVPESVPAGRFAVRGAGQPQSRSAAGPTQAPSGAVSEAAGLGGAPPPADSGGNGVARADIWNGGSNGRPDPELDGGSRAGGAATKPGSSDAAANSVLAAEAPPPAAAGLSVGSEAGRPPSASAAEASAALAPAESAPRFAGASIKETAKATAKDAAKDTVKDTVKDAVKGAVGETVRVAAGAGSAGQPPPVAGLAPGHAASGSAVRAGIPAAPQAGEGLARGGALERMDGAAPAAAPAAAHSSARSVAVGVEDPAHGWIEVRAQGAAGQVSASLSAASPEAHAALRAQLPGMAAYLAEREVGVRSLGMGAEAGGFTGHAGAGSNPGSNPGSNSSSNSSSDPGPHPGAGRPRSAFRAGAAGVAAESAPPGGDSAARLLSVRA